MAPCHPFPAFLGGSGRLLRQGRSLPGLSPCRSPSPAAGLMGSPGTGRFRGRIQRTCPIRLQAAGNFFPRRGEPRPSPAASGAPASGTHAILSLRFPAPPARQALPPCLQPRRHRLAPRLTDPVNSESAVLRRRCQSIPRSQCPAIMQKRNSLALQSRLNYLAIEHIIQFS